MEPFRHIMVATDFSEPASWARTAGEGLASSLGARMSLVHVVQPYGPLQLMTSAFGERDLEAEALEVANEKLEEERGKLSRVEDVSAHALNDLSTGNAICTLAEREGVDLIVVGTRGREGFERLLLGSVAEQVVRHGPCSVLTVGREAFAQAPLSNGIMVGTDLSAGSVPALDAASFLAESYHAPVTVVHAHDPNVPHPAPGSVREAFGNPDVVLEALQDSLNEDVRERFEGVSARGDVLASGKPADALCKHAAEHHPEVLIVATHGRSGLSRVLLGSVAERVVRHAPCPVLTVRRPS